MPKLTTPRVRFVLDDESEHEVQCLNIDMLTWDRERARRGWPAPDVAPMVWATFLAFTAAKRTGLIPPMSLDEFEHRALEVAMILPDAASSEPSEVDPTRAGADPA